MNSHPSRILLAALALLTAPLWIPLLAAFLLCAICGEIVTLFRPHN